MVLYPGPVLENVVSDSLHPPEEGKSAACTCSAAGELYVRWSLRGFEGFEVLHSVGPEAVGEVDAQA